MEDAALLASAVQRGEIPAWWLIFVGLVLAAYHALSLFGMDPTIQRLAGRVGVAGVLEWMHRFPAWQSPSMRRFGRILALVVAIVFLVWGILEAAGSNEAFVRLLLQLRDR